VLNGAMPFANRRMPADAAVLGSEPALVEAFTRLRDWLGGGKLDVDAEAVGAWWKVTVCSEPSPAPLPVPEMGEPLIRLIVDTHLNGWLDVGSDRCADVYLPAYAGR